MALDWGRVRVTSAPSTVALRYLTTVRPRSPALARRALAGLAAAYLLLVALGLPVAGTHEALDGAFWPPAVPADGTERLAKGHPPDNNPDDDFGDAIPVNGLVVFAPVIPRFDVPLETPGVLVGDADEALPRLIRTREDFERGPPSPA